MTMKHQRVKGTKDLLPEESLTWQWFVQKVRKILANYGYLEIRTPIFESTDLFVRSIGETTDIVEKEMYTFEDKGGRSLTLRPEGTAPVMRAMLEHNLKLPLRLFYYGSMYRQEKPQKGRFREHFQIGIENIGNSSPFADREVIEIGNRIVGEFKIPNCKVLLNSIGCPTCRGDYYRILAGFLDKNVKNLCPDCQRRTIRNPLRFFDCKNEGCQEIAKKAPKIIDYLCPDCREHHEQLKAYLTKSAIQFIESPGLARGLDYYTRTVFEFIVPDLGAQNTLIGGGRYDLLIEQLGGKPTPAVGFAFGIERMLLSTNKKITIPNPIYIAMIGGLYQEAMSVQQDLHEKNKAVILGDPEKSLKHQLREADRINSQWTIIIGSNELKRGKYILRNMESGEQKEYSRDDIVSALS